MVKIIDLNLTTPNEIISAFAIVITAMSNDGKICQKKRTEFTVTTRRERDKEKRIEISEGIKVKCERLLKMNRKYEGKEITCQL